MSIFKKLAGETALYGLSSIVARMVNFMLVPLHTTIFKERSDYGEIGQLFGWIALGVLFYSFRLEGAYFRYSSHDADSKSYAGAKTFTLLVVILCSFFIAVFSNPLAQALELNTQVTVLRLVALIMALDAICELPFARLRLEKRPIKFVVIKIINIGINVLLNVYFLLLAPRYQWPAPDDHIVSVFLANVIASTATLLLLHKEYLAQGFSWDKQELKKILSYSWPLLIVALAGVIDDAMSRQFIGWFATGTVAEKKVMMGEYNACVKFAVFITLFVQAFRYAAEPFFFKHMHQADAKKDYGRITTYFTLFLMLGYVLIVLYIDFIKHYIVRTPAYLQAMGIVPIVLMANVLLGIYYNMSNWYRLTDKTRYGMYTALIGMCITILGNIILVPRMGYYGTAWTLLLCYIGMTVSTYLWGQKYYPVPYELRKMIVVMVGGVLIYLLSKEIDNSLLVLSNMSKFLWHTGLFIVFVFGFYRKELKMLWRRE